MHSNEIKLSFTYSAQIEAIAGNKLESLDAS